MNTQDACLLLNHIFYLSTAKLIQALPFFKNDFTAIFDATEKDLANCFSLKIVKKIKSLNYSQYLEKVKNDLEKYNISFVTCCDEIYPVGLKEIYDYPLVLFYKGDLSICNNKALAVVGSRKSSQYGKNNAFQLSKELALAGVAVISGLARGIDTKAHQGALAGNFGTIAILGCGMDRVYPKENIDLSKDISVKGLLISEFAPGTAPLAQHFPYRNRIISGLSRGVLVVEAAKKSGSIITAMSALEQNRLVYSIPGKINDKNYEGCHFLLKEGAKIVTRSLDILEDFGIDEMHCLKTKISVEATTEEQKVLKFLGDQPISVDCLKEQLDFASLSDKIDLILLQLEIKKIIKRLPGQYYVLNYN